ncbi:MAG: hypothetical protein JXB14_00045, partial [Candidatus Altiarchaeota archaeon]|nr:hypothetical protein [Candidatus Altiarchaeota archaeon]
SQEATGLSSRARAGEALDAMMAGEDVWNIAAQGRKMAAQLSGIHIDPMRSRGEHFAITRLRVRRDKGVPVIVEDRLNFPRMEDMHKWKYIKRWWRN